MADNIGILFDLIVIMKAAWKIFSGLIPPVCCLQELTVMRIYTFMQPGQVGGEEGVLDRQIRRSRVGWPDRREHEDFFRWLKELVSQANSEL